MLNYVAAYACGEAIAYIKSLIAAKKINGELQRHIEILIERNSFLENDSRGAPGKSASVGLPSADEAAEEDR